MLVSASTTISNWSGLSYTYSSIVASLPLRVVTTHSVGRPSGVALPSRVTYSTAAQIRNSARIFGHIPQVSTGSSIFMRSGVQSWRRYYMNHISARLTQANSTHSGRPDPPSVATSDLFVYGTLSVDQVIRALIDRVPPMSQSSPGAGASLIFPTTSTALRTESLEPKIKLMHMAASPAA